MIVQFVCTMCGASFSASRGRAYCSDECRRVVHNAASRRWREENREQVAAYNEARRIRPVDLVCVECGGAFKGRSDRRYCSRRCKGRAYRRTHVEQYAAKQARAYRRRQERARSREGVPGGGAA